MGEGGRVVWGQVWAGGQVMGNTGVCMCMAVVCGGGQVCAVCKELCVCVCVRRPLRNV